MERSGMRATATSVVYNTRDGKGKVIKDIIIKTK
jgi:hypothetical protein